MLISPRFTTQAKANEGGDSRMPSHIVIADIVLYLLID